MIYTDTEALSLWGLVVALLTIELDLIHAHIHTHSHHWVNHCVLVGSTAAC